MSGAKSTRGAANTPRTRASPVLPAFLALYTAGVAGAALLGVPVGIQIAGNLAGFAKSMVLILPATFVLIGLFEVWVPREAVERHLGDCSRKLLSWFWMILLAGTTVGGLYVSFPIAWTLRRKGARLGLVFAYIGLAGVCRIPMTLFEISFMGLPFTVIRYVVSVPLVILAGELLGTRLQRHGYELRKPEA